MAARKDYQKKKDEAAQAANTPAVRPIETVKAVALHNVTRPGDHHQAYQPVVYFIQDDGVNPQILSVDRTAKRDLKSQAFAAAYDMVEPE